MCPEAHADAALQPQQPGLVQRPKQPRRQSPSLRLPELQELPPQLRLPAAAALPGRHRALRLWAHERLPQPQEPLEGPVLERHEVDDRTLTFLSLCGGAGGVGVRTQW